MRDMGEWNPYCVNFAGASYGEPRLFPWLYPYGSFPQYRNLWSSPERMEDEADAKRMRELYPLMARRLAPYVEEICDEMEYPGSMMYDEYPDQLSLMRKCRQVLERAEVAEDFGEKEPDWEELRDLIGVLLLQEVMRRRKRKREKGIDTFCAR
ncbi:MAG: hypothetical protein LUC98_04825 [Lachnospiraceae bacterium]|nr:hypothetical protein [Lachnospiraceae bacterium]